MIIVKSEEELGKVGEACAIVARVLAALREMVAPGVTTAELERAADAGIRKAGGEPAFKGYRGYPASICTSVNEQVVHGIPSEQVKLKDGDIVGIDLGVLYKGFYGDAAITVPVGESAEETRRLLRVTEEALERGIAEAVEGKRVSDISHAVQRHVEGAGYSVVRMFVGHGIGKSLHEEPQVPNYGAPGRGPRLQKGMTLAIEPMVNMGTFDVKVLGDGWTAVTTDGRLSAHFEHTVAVTAKGPKVLTRLDN
jgi:methionyl aminopeptidase